MTDSFFENIKASEAGSLEGLVRSSTRVTGLAKANAKVIPELQF